MKHSTNFIHEATSLLSIILNLQVKFLTPKTKIMKKFTILLIGLLTSMYAAYAGNPIDSVTASTVARNFYNHSTGSNLPSINLVHTEKVPNGDTVVYYIYNMPSNKGWVIVTADDAAQPILGYSTSGQYENKNVSPEFSFWMDIRTKYYG